MKRTTITTGGLLILAAVGIEIGIWGLVSPRSFYESFPGLGQHWLREGAFDEHLLRDFAALQLALGCLAGWAAWRRRADLIAAAGLTWLVWSVPHGYYHLAHVSSGGWLQGLSAVALPVLAGAVLATSRSSAVERDPSR